MSSRIQRVWSLAAGSTLENRPRWRNKTCFEPFPFPALSDDGELRERIGDLAEKLDAHRKMVQVLGKVAGKPTHLTNQYNALARAREARADGKPLTASERKFHEGALIGILASIHDELDEAVAKAYGWPVDLTDEQILENLVALNKERVAEEAGGFVRWLRPELQAPDEVEQQSLTKTSGEATVATPVAKVDWPKDSTDRLIAVRDALRSANAPRTVEELSSGFQGARRGTVEKMLYALVAVGAIVDLGEEGFVVPG